MIISIIPDRDTFLSHLSFLSLLYHNRYECKTVIYNTEHSCSSNEL